VRQTIRASWSLVTGPTQEPISLKEAKDHAKMSPDEVNDSYYRFIKTAREECEKHLGRGLLTQTWKLSLSDFANCIYLPMSPQLQSVSSVTYYDADGNLQTLSSSVYVVEADSRPGRIVLASGQTWPALQASRFGWRVFVTYVVGWTAPSLIPERIKQGIRMFVSYLDCDRGGTEQDGERAYKAAHACWDDRVEWIDPENWCEYACSVHS
jgi:uncharacterized phiE125 gp8 family phage protein